MADCGPHGLQISQKDAVLFEPDQMMALQLARRGRLLTLRGRG